MKVHVTYRRLPHTLFWHFCENCPDWPAENYEEVKDPTQAPAGGFCITCAHLRRSEECEGWSVY